jgi:predicted dehydrogenase
VQRYGPLPSLIGRAGELRHVRFSFVAGPPSRYVKAGCGWVLDRSVSGGGCLYLLGVHFTDMFRYVTGQEITAARSVRQYPDGSDTEDYGVLTLQTSGGTTATIEIGWTFPDAPGDPHQDGHKITGLQHTRLSYLQRPVGIASDHDSSRAALAGLGSEPPARATPACARRDGSYRSGRGLPIFPDSAASFTVSAQVG